MTRKQMPATPDSKADELRALIREANTILKDLKAVVNDAVKGYQTFQQTIEASIIATAKAADHAMAEQLKLQFEDIQPQMRIVLDECQQKVREHWKELLELVKDPEAIQLFAALPRNMKQLKQKNSLFIEEMTSPPETFNAYRTILNAKRYLDGQ